MLNGAPQVVRDQADEALHGGAVNLVPKKTAAARTPQWLRDTIGEAARTSAAIRSKLPVAINSNGGSYETGFTD